MITRWAIEHERVTWFCVLMVVVYGVMSYWSLPQAEDPGFVVRTAMVTTLFPGAAPARVEELVTRVIEERIQEIPELEVVRSTSRTGRSDVLVDIQEKYTDMRPIWDQLRRNVDAASHDLPAGAIGPFVDDELGDVFGVVLGLVAEGFSDGEALDLANTLRDEILRLPDAAKVEISGQQERQIYVEFDQAKLAELHLSPMQIRAILAQQNIVTPGGVVVDASEQLPIEPTGSFASLDDIARTVIALPGSSELLYLGDIAKIVDGTIDPPDPRVHVSGERALALAISLPEGGQIERLGRDVDAIVARFLASQPIGVDVVRINDAPADVRSDVHTFLVNLGQAVVIVILSMVPGLGLRTGTVVGAMIPLTMLATFIWMQLFGIGINTISLAALLIALGMLVDNMIVMSEATQLGMQEGKPVKQAAIDAAAELTVPLFVSAATTCASFLPIYLAKSITGEYTGPLFSVVTMALMSSWVVSITVTPLLCVRFMPPPEQRGPSARAERFFALYRAFLLEVLRRPVATIGVATVALAVSGWIAVDVLDQKFFPPSDKAAFAAELHLQPGATLDETERVVSATEAWIGRELTVTADREEGVTSWSAFVGSSAPRYELSYVPDLPLDSYAYLKLETTSRDAVDALAPKLQVWLEATWPDVVADVHPLVVGPPAGNPVAVRLSAADETRLIELADQVKAKLASLPGTRNIGDDWGRHTKKVEVTVDPARARLAGVSNADVALSLQAALSGVEVSEFRDGDAVIPVVLRTSAGQQDLGNIESLNVVSQLTGMPVPLRQVADVSLVFEAPMVMRRDLTETMEVYADVEPGAVPARLSAELYAWLDGFSADWGPGERWEPAGEADVAAKSQQSIADQAPIAALVMTALLVFQFNSVRLVTINLAVLPYALIGVTFGLLIAGSYVGFMTLLGVVSLFGIVLNNANILLDRIEIERKLGKTAVDAILESSTRRLSPILLTTGTTIAGLLPLWFGGGPVFEPMAIALLFGLAFGTLLTLALVPAMYALAYGVTVERGHEVSWPTPAGADPRSVVGSPGPMGLAPLPASVQDGLAPRPTGAAVPKEVFEAQTAVIHAVPLSELETVWSAEKVVLEDETEDRR